MENLPLPLCFLQSSTCLKKCDPATSPKTSAIAPFSDNLVSKGRLVDALSCVLRRAAPAYQKFGRAESEWVSLTHTFVIQFRREMFFQGFPSISSLGNC
jgi:hypothetical protein